MELLAPLVVLVLEELLVKSSSSSMYSVVISVTVVSTVSVTTAVALAAATAAMAAASFRKTLRSAGLMAVEPEMLIKAIRETMASFIGDGQMLKWEVVSERAQMWRTCEEECLLF